MATIPSPISSSLATPVSIANGGTGAATFIADAVVVGGTTATNPLQSVAALGNQGNPLVSGGAGALPNFTAGLAPIVFGLTDAATILVNAQNGNVQGVTITASRTMGAPSNPLDGMPLVFSVKQGGAGSFTISWTGGAGGYTFGTGSAPTLTTTAGATDYVGFRYNAGIGKWCYQGSEILGFS